MPAEASMSVYSCGPTRRPTTEPSRGGWGNCRGPDSSGWRWSRKWSRGRKRVKVKVDKTLVASVALHVLVIGWGLVSFSSRSLEAVPPESMPVEIISAQQRPKIPAGIKTGKKHKPKPLVEKIADPKPVEDAV